MKQWTVMLIPHDRGSTRTFHLNNYQIGLVALLLVSLSFTTSFFYGRNCAASRQFDRRLREVRQELERQKAAQATKPAGPQTFTAQERIEMENRLRSEYNASIATITSRLGELRDLEDAARKLTGQTSKTPPKEIVATSGRGGRGGGESDLSAIAYEPDTGMEASPSFIEGLSHPTADLIIQEIDLRRAVLQDIVRQLQQKQESILYYPNITPAIFFRHGISSPYGLRKDPFSLRVAHHDGMDIMGPLGSPVAATARGTVSFAGWDGELGNSVRISHGNGIETIYAHLQKILVKTGQKVERKEVVGKLGTTGRSTGPHLHYEIHVNGRTVNPAKYLRE
jgi:murein DD-endopeptidase MepM/ murein hydrolase activator NlpD